MVVFSDDKNNMQPETQSPVKARRRRQSHKDNIQPQTLSPAQARKRRRSHITGLLYYAILVVVILCVYQFSSLGSGMPRDIGGYSAMIVLTGSMQKEIPKGSLIVTRQIDPNTIQIGDDITYMKDPTTSITHRVVGIYENYDNGGIRGFQTQGVNNLNPDVDIVPASNVVGKVIFHSEKLGMAVDYIKHHTLSVGLIAVLAGAFLVTLRMVLAPSAARKGGPRAKSGRRRNGLPNAGKTKIPVYRYHVPTR